MFALALQLLVVAPMRVSNLVSLQFGRHILTTTGRHGSVTHLRVPKTKTNTPKPFEALLLTDTVALMTRFTERYRGQLSGSTRIPAWAPLRDHDRTRLRRPDHGSGLLRLEAVIDRRLNGISPPQKSARPSALKAGRS